MRALLREAVLLGAGVVALAITLATTAFAQAQPPVPAAQTAHARVTLIAARPDAAGVWAGLRFELQPGWHIYWRNPGDSGGPPTVEWRLPVGVSAGPLLWPAPERIPVGPLVNYGYHAEVTLPLFLEFARGAAARSSLVEAEVRWLICKDVCLNERASLGLALNGGLVSDATSASSWIDRARAQVPKKAPAAWRSEVTRRGNQFELVVTTDRRIAAATFFPLDESQIDDAAVQRVQVTGHIVRMTLKSSDQLTTTPAVLRGVVALDGAAFEIAAAVTR